MLRFIGFSKMQQCCHLVFLNICCIFYLLVLFLLACLLECFVLYLEATAVWNDGQAYKHEIQAPLLQRMKLSSRLWMKQRCVRHSKERLNKQVGPSTKSPPLRDMWQQNPLNPRPNPPTHTTGNPSHSHWRHTNSSTYPERGARRSKDGGGGASSDSYSMNVTSSQRRLHDTATKSELMDSFLSPVNMTGGVCVRGTGDGEGACLPLWRGTWANESWLI